MNLNRIILSTLLLLSIKVMHAQYPVDTEYKSIPTPEMAMPDYLETIVDNTIPTPLNVQRITTYYEPWEWYPTYEYPKIQVWNANQTLYRIRSWKVFNAKNHKEVQELTGSIYPSYWSNVNPDLIWSFKIDGTIKKYWVSTNTEETVGKIDGYDHIKLGPWEGNFDKKDKFVALVGKKGADLDVIIYDLQNLEIIHTENFAGAWDTGNPNSAGQDPKYIDWVSVSQSGDYVGIMWDHNVTSIDNPFNGQHYGVEIYRTTDMKFLRRIADYGDHGDFGYDTNGAEVFVQFWGPNNKDFVNMYYLDRMERVPIATHHDFAYAGHISCRNINRPGWTYLTISSKNQSGQILALKLDKSGIVEHFGHHFSTSTTYDKVPMGVPSPDGKKLLFKSDFGDAENHDLAYCFEVTLPKVNASDDISDEHQVLIFPNPANDNFTIKSNETIKEIAIFNLLGQKVKSIKMENSKSIAVDISSFDKGVYMVNISTGKKTITRKIIIKE